MFSEEPAPILGTPGSTTPVLIGCARTEAAAWLAETLGSWHFHPEIAATGTTALQRLKAKNSPSIALLDMDLPDPGGVQITWEIGRLPLPRPWIILLSAAPANERLRAALAAGCDDFLALPPDLQELKLRMRVAGRVRTLALQLHRQTAALHYQTTHDCLTGLWNREALLSLLFQETDRVQRMKTDLCLLLMDLDDFSRVNHDYGHEAGDNVLASLANRFRRQLRSYDLIGRCGGDQFLLALPGCARENAAALAVRIRATLLARPFAVGAAATTLTASFGLAVSRGRSPLVVLQEAEQALAAAKRAGKNCLRCAPPPLAPPISALLPDFAAIAPPAL